MYSYHDPGIYSISSACQLGRRLTMPSVLLRLKSHHFHLADLNEINQRDVCNLNFIFTVGGNNNISVQMQHLLLGMIQGYV